LLGDSSKARAAFGWEPRTSFKELVRMMVESDLVLAQREAMQAAHTASLGGDQSARAALP
jgi:GDPmannose 4,6-dehydratase